MLPLLRSRTFTILSKSSNSLPEILSPCRTFTTTPALPAKPLPPRMKFDEADLTISYLKGTGPGGQKINKTNSAVQIIHKPTGIVVKCQATRSRSQNAKTARALLADRVEELEKGDQSRTALKAEAAKKKKASSLKKTRRKYRKLEQGGEEPGQEMAVEQEERELDDTDANTNETENKEDGQDVHREKA